MYCKLYVIKPNVKIIKGIHVCVHKWGQNEIICLSITALPLENGSGSCLVTCNYCQKPDETA